MRLISLVILISLTTYGPFLTAKNIEQAPEVSTTISEEPEKIQEINSDLISEDENLSEQVKPNNMRAENDVVKPFDDASSEGGNQADLSTEQQAEADEAASAEDAVVEEDVRDEEIDHVKEEPTFFIKEFRVSGNTTILPKQLELVLYGYTGPGKKIEDIELARSALEGFYQDHGFPTVAVNLPPQNVASGIVHFEVAEGPTNIVSITGATYFTISDIRNQLPSLTSGQVLYLPSARAELAEINRQNRDLSVTPILKPGIRPGTLDIELRVKDELPVHGNLELNNRYTENSTETRLSGNISYDNLWQDHHSASLQYQVSPEDLDQVKVIVGTYVLPVTETGKLAIYVVESQSDVPAADIDSILGEGFIVGLRWIEPLTALSNYYHNFTFGFDYKDFDDSADGAEISAIDYSQFSIQYSGTYLTDSSNHSLSVSFTFAPEALGNDKDEFVAKRTVLTQRDISGNLIPVVFSEPSYSYWKLGLDNTITTDEYGSFFVGLGSQYSDSLLISNEQISLGGEDTVRGYLDSQASGDYGVWGQFEWRTNELWTSVKWLRSFTSYLFLDSGFNKLNEVSADQRQKAILSSAGLGFRSKFAKGMFIDGAWAYPFKEVGSIEKGEDRVHFSLGVEF